MTALGASSELLTSLFGNTSYWARLQAVGHSGVDSEFVTVGPVVTRAAPATNLAFDVVEMDRIDISGVNALQQLNQFLASKEIRLVLAGRRTELLQALNAMGMDSNTIEPWLFPTLHQAVRAFRMNPGQPGI